jgi:hypothetical protein
LPLIFDVKDGDFARGTCGMASDQTNNGVYFTSIQVNQTECVEPNEEVNVVYLPPEAARIKIQYAVIIELYK